MKLSQVLIKARGRRVIAIDRIEPLEPRIAPAAANLNLGSLDGTNGFEISGVAAGDTSGWSVSGAGDVNGDGLNDLIIGAYGADPHGTSGASYVIFGKASGFGSNLDLSALDGTNGFKLSGVAAGDDSGRSVSSAGDVNGDGFDDLIIGAPGASPYASHSGASYVVFGKASGFGANLELSALDGTNGFKLSGVAAGDYSGYSVSGAGDVNGDGFDDLIIGARFADPNGDFSGTSYVVFGKAAGFAPNLDLASLDGTSGFKLSGIAAFDQFGKSVSGAGDVNGDGFDDLIIGAPRASPGDRFKVGASYVIFGKASGFEAELDLSALNGANGFSISGVATYDDLGVSVSGAGDVNGDGFDDLIIGAHRVSVGGRSYVGASYVVFGKAGGFGVNLELSALNGANGFKLSGVAGSRYTYTSFSVSEAGDVDGDGFDDLIIGAPGANPNGPYSGASYLVFGKASGFTANLNLAALNGFRISGVAAGDSSGASVSGPGDINGDGIDDLIIGAPSARGNSDYSGASYVVFGSRIRTPADGRTATFTEADGDQVTIRVNKGTLATNNFIFAPDGTLQEIDLKGDPRFNGANITITAKALGGGNGVVDVGFLNATGLDVGKVKVSGTLGMIVAGDNVLAKPAIKSLTVGSLGTTDLVTEPLVSEVAGSLGRLIVQGDVRGAALDVGGKLGRVTIGGDLVGDTAVGAALLASIMEGRGIDPRVGGGTPVGAVSAAGGIASFTVKGSMNGGSVSSEGNIGSVNVNQDLRGAAVAAAGQIKVVKVFGSLTSEDPEQPTLVAALAKVGSTKAAGAVAINQLTVNGDVENAQILLGYKKRVVDDQASYLAKNPDASAGRVLVKGNWTASSLVAGVFDETGDGFGQNDVAIEGDTTTRILARIASIVIRGTATGSAAEGDHFAITAQQIGNLSIAGKKITLSKSKTEKDDHLLDETNGDFRVVEV